MAKKHKAHNIKHEAKLHVGQEIKKEENILTASSSVLMVVALIVGLGIGYFLFHSAPQASGGMPAINPGVSITPSTATISKTELASKVENYLNGMLSSRGMNAKVSSVNEGKYFMNLTVDVLKGGKPVQQAPVYTTKDGKIIIFGQMMDMSKPLPTPPATPTPKPQKMKKSDVPIVDMYVMAFCPYGRQAESGLGPAIQLLNNSVNFTPHYVIYSGYQGGSDQFCMANGTLCSMHGVQEVHEDARQLCIWEYQKDKWWNYVNEYNKECTSPQQADSCWKGVAEKVGVDTTKVENCFDNEAIDLLKNEYALNQKYGVQGSPTVFINGVMYRGGRGASDYQKAICSAFNTEPAECNQTLSGNAAPASGHC